MMSSDSYDRQSPPPHNRYERYSVILYRGYVVDMGG